jgi:hypothetical protein
MNYRDTPVVDREKVRLENEIINQFINGSLQLPGWDTNDINPGKIKRNEFITPMLIACARVTPSQEQEEFDFNANQGASLGSCLEKMYICLLGMNRRNIQDSKWEFQLVIFNSTGSSREGIKIQYLEGDAPGSIDSLHCIKVIDQANDQLDEHSLIEISIDDNGNIETFPHFDLPDASIAHEFTWTVCQCY